MRKMWACFKKIIGLLFFRFDDCGPFKNGPRANISDIFLPNTILLGSLILFFEIKIPDVKFNKVSSGGLNIPDHLLTGIRCQKDNTTN